MDMDDESFPIIVTLSGDVFRAVSSLAERYYDNDISACIDEHLWDDIIDTDDSEEIDFLQQAGVLYHHYGPVD